MTEQQPRDNAVLCQRCFRERTWNPDAICDLCMTRAAATIVSREARQELRDWIDQANATVDEYYEDNPPHDTWDEYNGLR